MKRYVIYTSTVTDQKYLWEQDLDIREERYILGDPIEEDISENGWSPIFKSDTESMTVITKKEAEEFEFLGKL
jgi:hypothetical protein